MQKDVFKAIADPVRREIIGLLAHRTLNLNAVAAHFDISRPAVSKHVKILYESGLITIQQQGRERLCKLEPNNLHAVSDWVMEVRNLWEGRLDAFEGYLERLQREEGTGETKQAEDD